MLIAIREGSVNKSTTVVLIFVALMIGLALGGMAVFHFGTRFIGYGTINAESAEAAVTVHALERLRAGDTNGAEDLLESRLDGALISVKSFLQSVPTTRRDTNAIQTLRLAKSYRDKFPRKTSTPEVDQAVAQALAFPDK
jgi:hypothetical protein